MRPALAVGCDQQIRTWLCEAGYRTETCERFPEARARLQAGQPEVVVASIRLGEFNGLHLAMLARTWLPGVHVAMISDWDDPVLRAEAARLGAAYLVKPVDGDELLTALQQRSAREI
jgi:DNA-binding response OmpR family regulator